MAMGASEEPTPTSSFDAHIAIEAASFSPSLADNMFYGGDYQGVLFGGDWSMGRYSAGASWAFYRVLRNGAEAYGVGDVMLNAQVAILMRHEVQAGVMLAVMAPTGDSEQGLGMGAAMLMPAGWLSYRRGRLALYSSAGYSRALQSIAISHGIMPTVDPMNMSELSWSSSADVALRKGLHAGARLSGGVPIAYTGSDRVIGALRVGWLSGRVDTGAELQVGLAGDPFNLRGLLATSMRF